MPITTATIDRQAKARVMKSKTSTLIPVLLCFFMPHTAIFYSGVKANNNRWMLLGTGYFLSLMFAMDMNERSMQEKSEPSIFFNLLIPVQIASAFAIRFKCIKQLEENILNAVNIFPENIALVEENIPKVVNTSPEKTTQALLSLQELYQKGIVTAEEYEQKRKELLIKL
jgi:Short C-terminal domain